MKPMKMKTKASVSILSAMAALLLCSSLTGCQSGGKDAFQMVICTPEVQAQAADQYSQALLDNVDSLSGKEISVQAVRTGKESVDPTGYAASIMKISTMVASKELDLVVMDTDNARESAKGSIFMPLSEAFTQEELAGFEDRLLSYDETNDEGDSTGNKVAYGIDISHIPLVTDNLEEGTYGVFIIRNAQELDAAKEALLYLANSAQN